MPTRQLNVTPKRLARGQAEGPKSYGYELYLPNVIRDHFEQRGIPHHELEGHIAPVSPSFYAAAWNLYRRGILRPGIRMYGAQATSDGASGNGYSVTPFGLDESDRDDYVPTEPDRFAQMLEPFRDQFGEQFYERAQEAVRCYGAHAYLACCAMCGASAESILLAAAIAKTDEGTVLAAYNTAQGRSRVEKMLVGKASGHIQREFPIFLALLKYWRDEASHGGAAGISDNEAPTVGAEPQE